MTKHSRALLLPFVTLVAAPALAQGDAAGDDAQLPRGERELAKLLDGRIAGEPVNCISDRQRDRMRVIDDTAFVFRDGDTIYVNRPANARFLDDWDLPVFKIFGSSLCRLDRVEMRDRTSLMPGPVFLLDDFVPYRRAEAEPGS